MITFIYLHFIGCLWAFDYGHKLLKNYEPVTPMEYIVLIIMSLLGWITLFGLFLGSNLKKGTDDENQ